MSLKYETMRFHLLNEGGVSFWLRNGYGIKIKRRRHFFYSERTVRKSWPLFISDWRLIWWTPNPWFLDIGERKWWQ